MRTNLLAHVKRVVIKIGSSVISDKDGLELDRIANLCEDVQQLRKRGYEVILVSSAAVAAGKADLGIVGKPQTIPLKQAAAAIGQSRLMRAYKDALREHNLKAAQVLLTRDDLANRRRYLNARNTLKTLLEYGIVPIINENDTVVVDELKLGDNDRLAAIVSHLVDASMLIILTDTKGLFSTDPRLNDDAELLTAVRHTDEILDDLHRSRRAGAMGSGGVATKIAAARMAAWSGIPTVIAAASHPNAAVEAAAGVEIGTWIAPRDDRLSARKLWIAFGLPSWGHVTIDAGAIAALRDRGGSLLAVGVTAVDGMFSVGDAVEVVDSEGNLVGKGLVRVGSSMLARVAGRHTSEVGGEVIHRDDLVVLV